MKVTRLLALLTAMSLFSFASAEPLKVGDPAPAVTGVTDTGAKLALADVYKQQPYTLVYFYPKADTPGCTKQGCSLRDGYEALTKKGVAVIGVSHDDVAAQAAFKAKYNLPFTLIADTDKHGDERLRRAGDSGDQPRHAFGAYLIDKDLARSSTPTTRARPRSRPTPSSPSWRSSGSERTVLHALIF